MVAPWPRLADFLALVAAALVAVLVLAADFLAVVAVPLAEVLVALADFLAVVVAAFTLAVVASTWSSRSWVACCLRMRVTMASPRSAKSPYADDRAGHSRGDGVAGAAWTLAGKFLEPAPERPGRRPGSELDALALTLAWACSANALASNFAAWALSSALDGAELLDREVAGAGEHVERGGVGQGLLEVLAGLLEGLLDVGGEGHGIPLVVARRVQLVCTWCVRCGSGAARRRGVGVLAAKRVVDVEQHLALALGEGGIGQHGRLHRLVVALGGLEDAGPDVQRLRRDPQRLGELLQHVGRRLAQPALDLAEVRVGNPGLVGELAQRELGAATLVRRKSPRFCARSLTFAPLTLAASETLAAAFGAPSVRGLVTFSLAMPPSCLQKLANANWLHVSHLTPLATADHLRTRSQNVARSSPTGCAAAEQRRRRRWPRRRRHRRRGASSSRACAERRRHHDRREPAGSRRRSSSRPPGRRAGRRRSRPRRRPCRSRPGWPDAAPPRRACVPEANAG